MLATMENKGLFSATAAVCTLKPELAGRQGELIGSVPSPWVYIRREMDMTFDFVLT